jgi:limonene-1,2-epoxide hydrolase
MAEEVVAAYQKALGAKNFEAARDLLKDDVRFKGPFEQFTNGDAYVKTLQGLYSIVESVEIKHVSAAGDEVVVLYNMVTTTPAGTQLICEWYGVEGGKIAWIRALFDTAPFAFLRQK